MNMNIKTISLIFILSCFVKSIFCMPAPQGYGQMPPPPSAEEIEEIMKSPEFTKMMEELEEIFKDEDVDESKPQLPEKPKEKIQEKTKPTAKSKVPSKPKSIEQNFLEASKPPTEKGDKDKLVKKLSEEKLEAFDYFINRFTKSLDNIEKKINSFKLGIAFKEYMENLGLNKSLNEINVAINQIRSKKLYKRIFFLPVNTELREEIIASLKVSEKLEKKIQKKLSEENEKETIDFLQQIASTEKKATVIQLNPLQKKLENLLNINLKNIDKKITTVALCTQAKEEIEKKIKLREKLEKDLLQKQKYDARRRPSSYRQPYSSGQSWPSYGSTKRGSYSGPGNWRNNYSRRGYTPRRYRPTTKSTSPKVTAKGTDKSSGGTRKLSGKLIETQNIIKNISAENIKSLKKIEKKYDAKNELKSFERIYKSKLLQKIAGNLEEIERKKATLTPAQKKQVENEQLKKAIIDFIPLGIRLAADPTRTPQQQAQQEAAQGIVETQPTTIQTELKKYEEEIIKKIEGKENLLVSFDTPPQDMENILRNLEILNNLPLENTERIDKIYEVFKKQYGIAQTNLRNISDNTIKQLGEIIENVGKKAQQAETKGKTQQTLALNLETGTNLTAIINQLDNNNIKKLFTEKVTEIVTQDNIDNMDNPLNEKQQERIKKAFIKGIVNIEAQKKLINNIGVFFKSLEQGD